MKKQNNNRPKNRPRGRRPAALAIVGVPKPVRTQPIENRVLRFVVSGSSVTDLPITSLALLRMLYITSGVLVATKTVYSLIATVRINRIKMYSASNANASGSAFQSCALLWFDSRSSQQEISATGTLASPAFINARPPKDSFVGDWVTPLMLNYTTQTMFEITLAGNSYIDVNLSYTLQDGASQITSWATSGTPTAGALYTAALDNSLTNGNWNTTPSLIPLSQTTLA